MSELWPWDEAEQREAKLREQQVTRRMGICVHFAGCIDYRGASDADGEWSDERKRAAMTCKAGVYWPDVELTHEPVENPVYGDTIKTRRSIPCNDRLNPCGATCAKRECPSREAAISIVSAEYRAAMERDR